MGDPNLDPTLRRNEQVEDLFGRYRKIEGRYKDFLKTRPADLYLHLTSNWMQDATGPSSRLRKNFDLQDFETMQSAIDKLERYFALLDKHPQLLNVKAFDEMVTDKIFDYLEQLVNEQ